MVSRPLAVAVSVLTVSLGLATALRARPDDPVDHFTALAINTNRMNAARSSTQVDMDVTRWSTDAERDTLLNTLSENGSDKMLAVLQKLPAVGSIRSGGSAGYDIHFARRTPMGDGERITLLTDRPVEFGEASADTRSMDYPFTLIELRVDSKGKGEGKINLAAKLSLDNATKTLTIENYEQQPVTLSGVERLK